MAGRTARPVFLVPENAEPSHLSVSTDGMTMHFWPAAVRRVSVEGSEPVSGLGHPATLRSVPFGTMSKVPPPKVAPKPDRPRYWILTIGFPEGTLEIQGYRVARERLVEIGQSLKLYRTAPDWV